MPQEDTAPYDDGSSTESECYDDELLEIKTEAADATCVDNSPPEPPVDVKVEAVDSVDLDQVATVESVASNNTKPKPKIITCKRCRRRLPVVSEAEKAEVQNGKSKTKRCACCEEHYPLSKFSKSNQSSGRAIPRCRSCTQGKNSPHILGVLRKSPEYAEAAAIELQQVKKERQEKRAKLPPFERKTPKQRYEEQFQIVGGKTARERRLAHRDAEKKKLLASRRMAKKAKKANKTSKANK